MVTPALAGGAMSLIGYLRRRQGRSLIRLDHFGYGFLFALAMAAVRFVWAR